ncbi:MAG: hypothetical protein AAGC77_12670 [Pseudomonadota bacterium]
MIRDRQARQERAQAAAMGELDAIAARKREQTNKLRKLRLKKEVTNASSFKDWREKKSSTN